MNTNMNTNTVETTSTETVVITTTNTVMEQGAYSGSEPETCSCGFHYKSNKPYMPTDKIDLKCPFIRIYPSVEINYPVNYNKTTYCNCSGASGLIINHYDEGLLNKALIENKDNSVPMFLLEANCDLKGCFKNILHYGNMELMKFLIEERGYYPCLCDFQYLKEMKDNSAIFNPVKMNVSLAKDVYNYLLQAKILVKCHQKPLMAINPTNNPFPVLGGITGCCGPTGPRDLVVDYNPIPGATGPQGILGRTSYPIINNNLNKLFYGVPSDLVAPGIKFPGLVLNEQFKETPTASAATFSLSGFYINFDELVSNLASYSLILETICHNKAKPRFYSVSNS